MIKRIENQDTLIFCQNTLVRKSYSSFRYLYSMTIPIDTVKTTFCQGCVNPHANEKCQVSNYPFGSLRFWLIQQCFIIFTFDCSISARILCGARYHFQKKVISWLTQPNHDYSGSRWTQVFIICEVQSKQFI